MRKNKIVPGRQFGRLIVLSRVTEIVKKYTYNWLCLCSCGNTTTVNQSNLATGNTSSCGCLRLEKLRKKLFIHGKTKSKPYIAWLNMIQRCTNPKNGAYYNYGARGIKVCARWTDFEKFYIDMGDPQKNETLERKDVNGHYSPKNCIWADRIKQSRNKRTNFLLTYKGKTACLKVWSEERGMNYWTLHARKRRGWSAEKIIETPIKNRLTKER